MTITEALLKVGDELKATMIETLKMGLGIIMIGYGVFRLRKKI